MPERELCLSRSARRVLLELAVTAMPRGRRFPAPGWDAVDRLDGFIARQPASWRWAVEAGVQALQLAARLRGGRSFLDRSPPARLALLESLHRGTFGERVLLRSLLAPLKMAHYDDPAIFAALGCAYRAPAVVQPPRPAYLERARDARSLAAGEVIDADVVIVGSGAGGAALAAELAASGVAVVLLEEGGFFDRRSFTGRPLEMMRLLYRNRGLTGTVGNCAIAVPLGRCVGGTTTINSGTCYRAPARVFARWREELGLHDFTPEAMDPYYAKVESVLQVTPASAKTVGGIGTVLARGCAALGYQRHHPLARNAPDCDGSGVCCFGCPTDAKRSANISYVPLALRYGANLFYNACVERVLFASGRAAGVEAVTQGGQRLTVRAAAVVLAAGALVTPHFLLRHGLARGSGQVGHNLSIHPAVEVVGLFPDEIRGFSCIPQGYVVEDFLDEGLLFEGGFVPVDGGAAALPIFGQRFTEVMEAYEHVAHFGFMIEDTSRGRVRCGPGGLRAVTYVLNDHDVAMLKRGVEILVRIYQAAGATGIFPVVAGHEEICGLDDLRRFRNARLRARDFDLTAHHPLGTARMGSDPRTSVVGPTHETHDVPGLFICDGSVVPSSLGVNPQLTIMALAHRAATFVARAVEAHPRG